MGVMYAYSSPPVRHKTGQGFLPKHRRLGTLFSLWHLVTDDFGVYVWRKRGMATWFNKVRFKSKASVAGTQKQTKEDLVGFAPSIDCFG